MKRVRSASDPRPQGFADRSLPLEKELVRRGAIDRHLQTHQAIVDLSGHQPSATFVQTWKGPGCIELLQECNSQDWVANFGHIATLFGMTALTDEITGPSPELIAHLLVYCPQIVDMTLDGFFADREQIPELKAALSNTSHLRSFHFAPEDVDPGIGLCIVRGLRSHHHLTSWRHWTDDDPGAIVPALARTLSGMQNLQCLDLCIDESWNADHFERIACQLVHMPALQDLRLSLAAGCLHLSSFFQAAAVAGGALPLASLRLDIARTTAATTRNTAAALIQAIASLPRLMSLCVSYHVFLAMDPQELSRAIRRNGAFDTLTFLDAHGRNRLAEIPDDLAAALRANRNRFDLAPVGMMGPACSAFVNVVLAQRQLGPVSDIGTVVAGHLVGRAAAPDLRDCHGVLRVSRKIWKAARDTRRQAMLHLMKAPSTCERQALERLRWIKLGQIFDIVSLEEAAQLADLHSHWLLQDPAALHFQ